MLHDNKVWVGSTTDKYEPQYILLPMANRHGLIAGATGTGKTTTLKVLAESFSEAGIPVFTADIKGDLTATCMAGADNEDMQDRIKRFGLAKTEFKFQGFPLEYWDVFEKYGHPVRATISEMGPILLSNIMELTDAQEGILNIAFQCADENEFLMDDIKDLRSVLTYITEHASEITLKYGNVTKQSVGAIVRKLVELENNGAEKFFGKPALDINDWLNVDFNGKGTINLLECSELFQKPKLYSTFMLWMLSSLYEALPEVGDLEKPRIVFFFDEAHLLFDDAPKALIDKITQTVRLVRSKGVGVYFCTQNPTDLPAEVLAQLSNRIQHALRAYTPADQKNLKATCDTFRANKNFKTEDVITELGKGEALVTFLDENAVPGVVQRVYILPPESHFGSLDDTTLQQMIRSSRFDVKYGTMVDDRSAYEVIEEKTKQETKEKEEAIAKAKQEKEEAKAAARAQKEEEKKKQKVRREIQRIGKRVVNRATDIIVRNILGTLGK